MQQPDPAPNVIDVTGDLLAADVDALVNPVNGVGVMGKGLALQFKRRFPANYAAYRDACNRGEMQPGNVLTVLVRQGRHRYVINFPTKRHWRDPSRMEDIEAGLEDLAKTIRALRIESIAVPALGCGLGGLDWNDVRPRIVAILGKTGARVLLYAPRS
ncbi:macro domain-containing protein [Micromonospora sp. C51]|uniref:macro domain-containing protein n=1 Tax=Micromonospora sp. C51 TaxID=2824879 RepID=UPI001B39A9B2|nr:macro domain-containing protein [Micromonospora sp. C51]MBQ1047818.1 macro domain-containing protein [Micromonospora sp. C51]